MSAESVILPRRGVPDTTLVERRELIFHKEQLFKSVCS